MVDTTPIMDAYRGRGTQGRVDTSYLETHRYTVGPDNSLTVTRVQLHSSSNGWHEDASQPVAHFRPEQWDSVRKD